LRHQLSADFVRNVAKLAGGTVLAQLVMVLASPVLTRLYDPAAFGTLAVYSGTVAVAVVVASARYEVGIIVAGTKPGALRLVSLSGVILLLLGLVFSLVALGWPALIVRLTGFSGAPSLLYFLPVSFLALGSHQIMVSWSNRMKDFGANAFSKVVQSLSQVAVALCLGWFSASGAGLILSQVTGAVAAAGVLAARNRSLFPAALKQVKGPLLRHTLYRYREFPLFSVPTAILDTVSLTLPVFLISGLYNESLTGQYSLAYRILSLPVNLVGISVGQVFYQKLSETFKRKGNSRGLITSTWAGLALFGLGPMLLLLFFGPEFFRLVFGEEWGEAGRIAAILAIPLFLAFCSSPTSSAFIVFKIQRFSIIFGGMAIVFRPLAFYLGYLQADFHLSLLFWAGVEVLLLVGYNVVVYRKAHQLAVASKTLPASEEQVL
jgi:lipopolysaccharide exporter